MLEWLQDGIHLIAEDERQLVLRGCGVERVVDRRFKTVKTRGKVVARFEDIRSIDITRRFEDEGTIVWRVALNLGWLSTVKIGQTTDEVQASIAAARLCSFTGKEVRSL